MVSRIRQFLVLSRLTAMEALRQPVCFLLAATGVCAMALVPMLLMYGFGDEGRIARDSGLAVFFVTGVFVCAYAACSTLARELRRGTAAAVLSKPVGRSVFLLAKLAGVLVLLLLFSFCMTVGLLISERVSERFETAPGFQGFVTDWLAAIMLLACPVTACALAAAVNYRCRKAFASSAFLLMCGLIAGVLLVLGCFDRMGNFAPYDLRVDVRILAPCILVLFALVVLSSVAVSLSTRLQMPVMLSLCGVILVLGLLSDYAFGRYAADHVLAGLCFRIVPNWQHFWVSDGLVDAKSVPLPYIANAALYALTYSLGAICLGLLSFRNVELK